MLRRLLPATLFGLAIFPNLQSRSLACSCAPPEPACAEYNRAAIVFTGVVKSVDAGFFANLFRNWIPAHALVTFEVQEVFAGGQQTTAEVATAIGAGGHCGMSFTPGESYLLYGFPNTHHKDVSAPFEATICSRSSPISGAGEDLRFLRSLSATKTGSISGLVRRHRNLLPARYFDTGPARNVLISVSGAERTWQAKTDERGNYEVSGVPPGEYQVAVVAPDAVSFEGTKGVRLLPGGCRTEDFTVLGTASIGGRLLSIDGRPLARQVVELTTAQEPDRNCQSTLTDSNGLFRFIGLDAGGYYVGVSICTPPQPFAQLIKRGNPYAMSLYPAGREFVVSSLVRVSANQRLTLDDWRLPRQLEPKTIRGRIVNPFSGGHAQLVSLIDTGYGDTTEWLLTDRGGNFELHGFHGIDYAIEVVVTDRGKRSWPVPLSLEGPLVLTVQ